MNKTNILIITILALIISAVSCKDQKTYADYLKEETKAIDEFIVKNNLNILSKFLQMVFLEIKIFIKIESKVYYNIVEYGDTTDNIFIGEKVFVRFMGLKYFMTDDSTTYTNNDNINPQEIEFIGPVNSSTRSFYSFPGWAVPLPRIGHNAIVKMIVPFNMGSSTERSQYQATYYDRIGHRFESKVYQ